METKFNFNSAICTSRVQSEKLLALGLKKETADMGWQIISINGETVEMKTEDNWERQEVVKNHFPAWSLHRLLSMLNEDDNIIIEITAKDGRYGIHSGYDTEWHDNLYDGIIAVFDELIKEGYFNKEYLV